VGWANDIAGDPAGTRALALSFRSVDVVGGPLRGADGYWERARRVGSPACQGQFGVCVVSEYLSGGTYKDDLQSLEGNKGHQRPLLPSLGHLGRVQRTEEERRRRGDGETRLDGGITIFGYPSSARAAQEPLLSQRLSHMSRAEVVAWLAQNGGLAQRLGRLEPSQWQH